MTNSINHTQTIGSIVSQGETTDGNFDLPDDYRTLAAMKAAIEIKMTDMQTARAEALRDRFAEESAVLGLTPEEIVSGTAGKKSRRKPKPKRDE